MRKFIVVIATILPVLLIQSHAFAQRGTLSGVITYYFNQYQGDKPDIGAQVYIISDSSITQSDLLTIDSFKMAKQSVYLWHECADSIDIYKDLLQKAKYKGKKKREAETAEYTERVTALKKQQQNYYNDLVNYRAETGEKVAALDKRASDVKNKLSTKWVAKKTVDGAGNYSIELKPGTYILFVVSNGRNDDSTQTEATGKVYLNHPIVIAENETIDISYKFDLN